MVVYGNMSELDRRIKVHKQTQYQKVPDRRPWYIRLTVETQIDKPYL